MKRLSLLTLIFAILSLVFTILLVFLRFKFPPYPLVSDQDAFDILTPLVLIPAYWLLFRHAASDRSALAEEIAFCVLAAFWVEGHGMHLSANSIHNLIDALARNQVIDLQPTDIYRLTYFFDERLGHYVWHVGILGLGALLTAVGVGLDVLVAVDGAGGLNTTAVAATAQALIIVGANMILVGFLASLLES